MKLKYLITSDKLFLAMGIIGALVIILITNPYGIGLSPDSVGYVGTSREIIKGNGIVSFDGEPLTLQPPLYPVLLALAGYIFRTDPFSIAHIVHAVLFGLIIYLSGLFFLKYSNSYVIALLGTASLLAAKPLLKDSLMAWSEPCFILCVLFYLINCKTYQLKKDTTSLLLLSLAVGLACLTRYIGVILIVTGASTILILGEGKFKTRIWHMLVFMSVSTVGLGIFLLRNYYISGRLFGPRAKSLYTLSTNIELTLNTFLDWHISRKNFIYLYLLKHISIFWSLILVILLVIILKIVLNKLLNVKNVLRNVLREDSFLPVLVFVTGYTVFLIISSTMTGYDKIGDRLLSPVFIPITLLLLLLVSKILMLLCFFYKPIYVLMAAGCSLWWLTYQIELSMPLVKNFIKANGAGYNTKSGKESEIIQYLKHPEPLECSFYTNDRLSIYMYTNIVVQEIPAKTLPNSKDIINSVDGLKGSWPKEDNACLVWFDKRPVFSRLFRIDELNKIANMHKIIQFEDGAIYSVRRLI